MEREDFRWIVHDTSGSRHIRDLEWSNIIAMRVDRMAFVTPLLAGKFNLYEFGLTIVNNTWASGSDALASGAHSESQM
jgi:hypothetical protein